MRDGAPKEQLASYWQETTTRFLCSSELPARADVVVIGGGILGTATCYWLARKGVPVCLLEQETIAHGATGRNGGFVSLGPAESYPAALQRWGSQTTQAILRFTRENAQLLLQLLAEERIRCDYDNRGSLHLATTIEQWHALSQEAMMLQAEGIHTAMLDRQQVQDAVRTPLSSEILGGRWLGEDGVWHPIKFVQGLLAASQRYGAQTCQAKVVQILPRQEEILLHTTRGTLHAGTAVVATNAWLGELLSVYHDVILPVRGQMLAYAPTSAIFSTGMSASLSPTGEYWHQQADGAILLGGCRAAAPHADVGINQSTPTQEVQAALEQVLPRLFPQMKDLQVQHRWAGLMAFTPDFLPIADHVPEVPRLWGVGGFCGHGMPFGMRLGQLIAEALITGEPPSDLELFRLDRPTF